jgi:hypothetical protein
VIIKWLDEVQGRAGGGHSRHKRCAADLACALVSFKALSSTFWAVVESFACEEEQFNSVNITEGEGSRGLDNKSGKIFKLARKREASLCVELKRGSQKATLTFSTLRMGKHGHQQQERQHLCIRF